jgi:hypothetical protein
MLAGFQSWENFQEALHGDADAKTNFDEWRCNKMLCNQKKTLPSGQRLLFFCEVEDYSALTAPERFSLMRAALPVSLRR